MALDPAPDFKSLPVWGLQSAVEHYSEQSRVADTKFMMKQLIIPQVRGL